MNLPLRAPGPDGRLGIFPEAGPSVLPGIRFSAATTAFFTENCRETAKSSLMGAVDRDQARGARRVRDDTPAARRFWYFLTSPLPKAAHRTPILSLVIGGILLALAIDACA